MPWLVPALLHRRGLVPALAAQLNRTHPQARLDIDDTGRPWLARAVEAAGDLFCLEVAPTDLPSRIQLRVDNADQLVVAVGSDATGQTNSAHPRKVKSSDRGSIPTIGSPPWTAA